ncbi:MAG: phosphoribosylformylglycinamidine synthase subunit PurQ [Ignavibacteria bacterium]|nr:phosphoribosylformylglycinamidine synthase subunit PurQ [Ignavibacteria bacterium]
MKIGVITFPGSNCDADARYAATVSGHQAVQVWHKDEAIPSDAEVIILPGGFSYGDYLRTGAIARFSPIMKDVKRFASEGGLVIGICNGFQILCESGLLPGALIRNENLQFVCRDVLLRVENTNTPFTSACHGLMRIPIAHGEGRYIAPPEVLERLEAQHQVVFRYVNELGEATKDSNPNGSINNIAGIINEAGNVIGMMPHPERAIEPVLGSSDGMVVFESLTMHVQRAIESTT